MVVLYILGALVLLIGGVLFIRGGVYASFGESLRVWVKVGPVTKQILPKPVKPEKGSKKERKKAKDKKKKKGEEQKEEESGEGKEKKEKKKLDLSFDEIRSAAPALFESLKRGLGRTRKRLRFKPFDLSVTFGGDNPADVAEMYGKACSAMWTVMPQMERLVRLPDPRIHLDVDYKALKTRAEGEIGVSIQIRDVFSILWCFGIPVLKWYRSVRKSRKSQDD